MCLDVIGFVIHRWMLDVQENISKEDHSATSVIVYMPLFHEVIMKFFSAVGRFCESHKLSDFCLLMVVSFLVIYRQKPS